jgi:hypothetical protein
MSLWLITVSFFAHWVHPEIIHFSGWGIAEKKIKGTFQSDFLTYIVHLFEQESKTEQFFRSAIASLLLRVFLFSW